MGKHSLECRFVDQLAALGIVCRRLPPLDEYEATGVCLVLPEIDPANAVDGRDPLGELTELRLQGWDSAFPCPQHIMV